MPLQRVSGKRSKSPFIVREHAGKGMGKLCFDRLEADARQMGMENIIAEISLETA